jgi:gamma-glutamylcysteine synthetase
MTHVTRSNILINICLLVFLILSIAIINDFLRHRWILIYLIKCTYKILVLEIFFILKSHKKKMHIQFFLEKKNPNHCSAREQY